MSKHPLTDALCATIWAETKDNWLEYHEPSPTERRVMRATYDLAVEQCVEWLDNTHCDDPQETATRLRQAMRPQEDN